MGLTRTWDSNNNIVDNTIRVVDYTCQWVCVASTPNQQHDKFHPPLASWFATHNNINPRITTLLTRTCSSLFDIILLDVGKKATEAGRRFQETATVATRQMQESAKNANISSPLPDTSAAEDLKKAANLLKGFVDKEENELGFDNIIPTEVLRQAKGLAIYTVIKAVMLLIPLYTVVLQKPEILV